MTDSNVGEGKTLPETPEAPDAIPYQGQVGSSLHPAAVLSFGPIFEHINKLQQNQTSTHAGVHITAAHWCKIQDTRKLKLDNITFGECIGKGSFGNVYNAVLVNGEKVAIKQVAAKSKISGGLKSYRTDLIWKERDFLLHLQHPRVVKMLGAFYEGGTHFVFERCFGDIQGKTSRMTENTRIRFACQLLQGLEWIHSKNILHCDIRPENLLIKTNNNLAIGDFGSAVLLPEGNDYIKLPNYKGVAEYSDHLARTKFIFGKSTDIFAAACVIYEICTGDLLQGYHRSVKSSPQANSSRILHPNGEDLIRRVLKKTSLGPLLRKMVQDDFYSRPSAADCLSDPELIQCLKDLELTLDNIDKDADTVTLEFGLLTDKRLDYQPIETQNLSLKYSLHAIYYEKEEPMIRVDCTGVSVSLNPNPVTMEPFKAIDTKFLKEFIDANSKCFLPSLDAPNTPYRQADVIVSTYPHQNQDHTIVAQSSIHAGVQVGKTAVDTHPDEKERVSPASHTQAEDEFGVAGYNPMSDEYLWPGGDNEVDVEATNKKNLLQNREQKDHQQYEEDKKQEKVDAWTKKGNKEFENDEQGTKQEEFVLGVGCKERKQIKRIKGQEEDGSRLQRGSKTTEPEKNESDVELKRKTLIDLLEVYPVGSSNYMSAAGKLRDLPEPDVSVNSNDSFNEPLTQIPMLPPAIIKPNYKNPDPTRASINASSSRNNVATLFPTPAVPMSVKALTQQAPSTSMMIPPPPPLKATKLTKRKHLTAKRSEVSSNGVKPEVWTKRGGAKKRIISDIIDEAAKSKKEDDTDPTSPLKKKSKFGTNFEEVPTRDAALKDPIFLNKETAMKQAKEIAATTSTPWGSSSEKKATKKSMIPKKQMADPACMVFSEEEQIRMKALKLRWCKMCKFTTHETAALLDHVPKCPNLYMYVDQ